MSEELKLLLARLRLPILLENWDQIIEEATRKSPPYGKFLTEILKSEFKYKSEKARLTRQKKATMPDLYTMATYPFNLQPKLNRKQVLEIYDSLSYMVKPQNIAFIGPTGCGKTGLATAYLNNAIDKGYTGKFILFSDLISELYKSVADHSTPKIMKRYTEYDCLLVDELGYIEIDVPAQAGLLFKLLRARKKCTVITSNLGFDEWEKFLNNANLAAALVDKFTANCNFINMLQCKSITPRLPTKN